MANTQPGGPRDARSLLGNVGGTPLPAFTAASFSPRQPPTAAQSVDLFTTVARVIEQQSNQANLPPALAQLFSECAYFKLPKRSFEIPNDEVLKKGLDAFNEGFFLPFPKTAVHDSDGIVVIGDLETKQQGLKSRRTFAIAGRAPEWLENPHQITVIWGTFYDATLYTTGETVGMSTQLSIAGYLTLDKKKVISKLRLTPDALSDVSAGIAGTLAGTVKEIALANLPSRFIVECDPAVPPTPQRKIQWTDARPSYTILTPNEIKNLFRGKEGTDDQLTDTEDLNRSPHHRRAHIRTFRNDRFVTSGLQGSSIIIPATWVGPSEAQVGVGPEMRRYRVRLDL